MLKRRFITSAATLALTGIFAADASAQTVHYSGRTPDYHVVRSGDTLWDLSGSYYGDQYNWPRLWSYNAHVTNPHWIYPGDIVYLKTPSTGKDTGSGDPQVVAQTQQDGQMVLPVAGFVSADRIEYAGRIIASPKEANMLSPLDKVWVGFGEESYTEEEREDMDEEDRRKMAAAQPNVGELYAVVREVGEVKTDEDDDEAVAGYKYLVLGTLRIDEVSDKYHDTAVVMQTWREIERGDYLIPYERQVKNVQPTASDRDGVAKIVDSVDALFDFGEHHYVWVNKGADDGIRTGNRMFVYQRFEGLDSPGEEADSKIPWQRVGQLMVLDVRKNYSLAVITDSSREINIGDRLEMYQGF